MWFSAFSCSKHACTCLLPEPLQALGPKFGPSCIGYRAAPLPPPNLCATVLQNDETASTRRCARSVNTKQYKTTDSRCSSRGQGRCLFLSWIVIPS